MVCGMTRYDPSGR